MCRHMPYFIPAIASPREAHRCLHLRTLQVRCTGKASAGAPWNHFSSLITQRSRTVFEQSQQVQWHLTVRLGPLPWAHKIFCCVYWNLRGCDFVLTCKKNIQTCFLLVWNNWVTAHASILMPGDLEHGSNSCTLKYQCNGSVGQLGPILCIKASLLYFNTSSKHSILQLSEYSCQNVEGDWFFRFWVAD